MKIPKIKFTDEFEAKSDIDKISYLKTLASTMNNAADIMQKERNALAEEVKKNTQLLENAEKALMIQKSIVSNHLISGNLQIQELSNQIVDLQMQLKAAHQIIEKMKAN
jgi:seryl-tRNA synthetase